MSRRRRGMLRLTMLVVVVTGGAAVGIVVAGGGGSNPGRKVAPARAVSGMRTETVVATPVARLPAAPALVVPPAVRKLATGLSLDRQVAQLFLVGFTGTDTSAAFFTQLQSRDWGGVMLTHDNYVDPGQLATLAAQVTTVTKAAGHVAPFVAAPQHGGTGTAFPDLPPRGEPAVGATGLPDAARVAAVKAGTALHQAGLNMVFAPDADVGGESSAMADRTFSADPAQVGVFTASALDGYAKTRVIAAVGSFPGEGGASGDPNLVQATVGGSLAELRVRDLVPFAAVAAKAPAIVVSNALYAAFDGVTPAVLLPAVVDRLLRRDLRFGGVVVSGDLGATVQATGGSIGPAAVQALRAGCDLLYVQGNSIEQETAYRAVLAAARSGALPRARVLASVERVLALKASYGLMSA